MKLLGRNLAHALGAGVVALLLLFPKTTQAEAVEDSERMGEWDSDVDGQRFGAVVVKGELVAVANAPGGWTLVRTYENTSDDPAEIALEERVQSTDTMQYARVGPPAVTVLARTQKLKLAAHEKKSIGTYLPAALGEAITKAKKTQNWAAAQLGAGGDDRGVTYAVYGVQYLRPLAPGETVAVHENDLAMMRPARMPAAPLLRPVLGDDDLAAPAPAAARSAKAAPLR